MIIIGTALAGSYEAVTSGYFTQKNINEAAYGGGQADQSNLV